MPKNRKFNQQAGLLAIIAMGAFAGAAAARADETCQSPYMAKIEGEEEFV